jgi:hypothetical protein
MRITILPLAVLLGFASHARAENPASWDARITQVEGDVVFYSADSEEGVPAEAGVPLEPGDRLETGQGARAEVALEADSLLELGGGTVFTVDSLKQEDAVFGLTLGSLVAKFRSLVPSGRRARVRTPTAVAAVRGTEFGLEVSGQGETTVGVFDEGKVAVQATGAPEVQETILQANEETVVPRHMKGGRALLAVRSLSRLRGRMPRLERIRARRADLRRSWQSLPPARRIEARRAVIQRLRESLKRMPPEKRRQILRRMRGRADGGQPREGLRERRQERIKERRAMERKRRADGGR